MNLEVGMYVRFKPELKEKICKIKEFKSDGFIVSNLTELSHYVKL